MRDAVRAGDLASAHDVAEGGFLVAVAESCLAGGIGATLDEWPDEDPLLWLFGECPGAGFVVSGPANAIARLGRAHAAHGVRHGGRGVAARRRLG